MQAKPVPVGKGSILATREEFVYGYQSGHLTYMAARTTHPHLYTDEEVATVFFEKLEDITLSDLYSIGFVVGWMHTLASNGTPGMASPLPDPLEGHTREEGGT